MHYNNIPVAAVVPYPARSTRSRLVGSGEGRFFSHRANPYHIASPPPPPLRATIFTSVRRVLVRITCPTIPDFVVVVVVAVFFLSFAAYTRICRLLGDIPEVRVRLRFSRRKIFFFVFPRFAASAPTVVVFFNFSRFLRAYNNNINDTCIKIKYIYLYL